MLHSYEAQLQGNQVIWLGTAPPPQSNPRRVLVVLDEQPNEAPPSTLADILRRARGALGHGKRELVLAELAKSRQEWER
ncbi:hypothetical protein [Rhodoferax sp.]|uniref:hypothetical protein n=1 Tax=Rhodoferax sp. TaxID=50421 RepID=UPI00276E40D2|nr:hypothetical protein [Rhodoferax sp.]